MKSINTMITKNPTSNCFTVRPSGDIDALEAEKYRQQTGELFDEGYRDITVDLEDTPYITSSGLGWLVAMHQRMDELGGKLHVINLGPRLMRLLHHTKLDTILLTEAKNKTPIPNEAIISLSEQLNRELLFCSRLNEVSQKALKATNSKEVAHLILDGVITACRAKRGVFYFYDECPKRLVLCAAQEIEDSVLEEVQVRVLDGPSPEAEALDINEVIYIHEPRLTDGDSKNDNLREGLGFERAIILPITGTKSSSALVILEEPVDQNEPLETMRPLLRTFAGICGLALEKIDLLQQFSAKNEHLERTLESVSKFQHTLIDASKLAALGAMISGLGHVMNNKLVPIIGYTELLSHADDLPEKTRSSLETVNNAATELKEIMEKLIKVSRVREISRDRVDLNEIISSTTMLFGHQFEQNQVTLNLKLEDGLPLILGDHDLLAQAFLVIIHRACMSFDSETEQRWLKISTRQVGAALKIEFEDNGSGLGDTPDKDWLDPLAPYTELSQGRLFNYSIPRSVIKRHLGSLELSESAQGGTLVRVTVPISNEPIHIESESAEESQKQIA